MEPVLLGLAPALITGLIAALANAAKAFGWDITDEQVDAINKLAVSLMLVLAGLGAWYARSKSTPVAAPTLPTGTTVTVTDPSPDVADTKVDV